MKDFDKIAAPGSIEITLDEIPLALDNGERVYGYWNGHIVKIASRYYLDKYREDLEGAWIGAGRINIGRA